MGQEKIKPQAIVEVVFDGGYLIFAICAGFFLLGQAAGRPVLQLYGALALVLGGGDAFHLLPRMYGQLTDSMEEHRGALGFGKLVTSVTMTAFYGILYFVWRLRYPIVLPEWLTGVVLALCALRVVLCLLPQNGWGAQTPPLRFAIYRNIPFVLLGGIVAVLFAVSGFGGVRDGLWLMCPAIVLSFGFYLAVVLFAGKHRWVGALMLPKTATYIWMICMGFSLV